MAEAKKRLLTYAGLKALEDELENLKVVKRKEVAGKIKEAREQGDLSENAEYDAAKDEQRDIEARIEELEGILKNAEVVVEDEVDLDTVVTLNLKDYDSAAVADELMQRFDIAVRSGGHCAPLMHKALKTGKQGAVRFSFSHFNTMEEVQEAVKAMRILAWEG